MKTITIAAILLFATLAAAAPPTRTLHLEEQWRLGGAGADLLIGTVAEAAADADGNVYLLDSQLCHVLVVAPDGSLQRTISGEGDGPGEVRQPRDVVVLPDGSIGLMTMFPAKLVRLTPDGEPLPTLEFRLAEGERADFVAGIVCLARGGNLVLGSTRMVQTETGQEREFLLGRWGLDGAPGPRYRTSHMTLDFSRVHFVERENSPGFHRAVALGPDGRVVCAPTWQEYAVEVYAPDGTLERVLARPFENRDRTALELQRVNDLYDASARNSPVKQTREVEPQPPAIASLHVDGESRVWVEHSRSGENLPDGVMLAYDVIAPDGATYERVLVACEGDAQEDGLALLPDGRWLLLKGLAAAEMAQSDLGNIPLSEGGAAAPMEFVCYRVVD